MDEPDAETSGRGGDPVVERRRRIEAWVDRGQRLGYGLFALAVVAFVAGFATGGLEGWSVSLVLACLVVGSLVLAPAIVFGHAVRAADRADREDSW